jgi:glutathione-specific gamma-glutamylcyclotransferase
MVTVPHGGYDSAMTDTADAPPDPPTPESPRLTRELLLGGGLSDMIARRLPHIRVLTDAERHASLHAALAERPEVGDGIWLFAYGSLIWNPTVNITGQRVAQVHGWHRAFCLKTPIGRGSPDNPGLVLGLRRGGDCMGAALRLAEDGLEHELDVLWRREMVASGYVPRWLAMTDADGAAFGHGLTFTIDPAGPGYEDELPETEVVRRLATARGELGSSAEYLFRTWHGLRSMGVRDPQMERIAALVRAWQGIDTKG